MVMTANTQMLREVPSGRTLDIMARRHAARYRRRATTPDARPASSAAGAVIVSTPQDLALISMPAARHRHVQASVDVPVLGSSKT